MNEIQHQFVKKIVAGSVVEMRKSGSAFAASNIALCKYWGKRDAALNLPVNSSLSISLGRLGTRTQIRPMSGSVDRVLLNGELQARDSSFAARISAFLDLFRDQADGVGFEVVTENNIPTAAGLASSASGFAALVLALNELMGWALDGERLSMLARLGSGSASRSIFDGFVRWNAGGRDDGTDSFAEPLAEHWPNFRIGILELCSGKKPVGSRDGMNRTVETSRLYKSWPEQAAGSICAVEAAIAAQDFKTLGEVAEHNALSMHATMMSAWPPLVYMQPETIEQMHKVWAARADGLEVYLTMDAGPNIKLLFTAENEAAVRHQFPAVQVVAPF